MNSYVDSSPIGGSKLGKVDYSPTGRSKIRLTSHPREVKGDGECSPFLKLKVRLITQP